MVVMRAPVAVALRPRVLPCPKLSRSLLRTGQGTQWLVLARGSKAKARQALGLQALVLRQLCFSQEALRMLPSVLCVSAVKIQMELCCLRASGLLC
jgi:hypothetical protein